ncbi:MAG: VCBS repeat-containing protein [Clostridia bacterium]
MPRKKSFCLLLLSLFLLCVPAPTAQAKAPDTMGTVQIHQHQFPAMDIDGDGRNDAVSLVYQEAINVGQETILHFAMGSQRHYVFSLGINPRRTIVEIDAGDVTGDGMRDVLLSTTASDEAGNTVLEYFVLQFTSESVHTLPLPTYGTGQIGYAFESSFDTHATLNLIAPAGNFLLRAPLDPAQVGKLYTPDGHIADIPCVVQGVSHIALTAYGAGCALSMDQPITTTALPKPLGVMRSTIVFQNGEARLVMQQFKPAPI